ncbi:MAG: dephospho-CoA kinase [Terrisporobacter sp.]|uniref:dephospho-CoA kinase n=1 Tax=Terrisporobacter sp. TaxID=1965305 RepID=UPI002FCBBC4B
MLIVGLSGNIGCGKSSLSKIFMEEHIDVVDADIVSRQIFEDEELLETVFEKFGPSIKNEDGSLNRKVLGNIVFNDDNKLIELNNLTHPKIKQKILNQIKCIKEQNKSIVILDGALLVETGYLDDIDKLLVIICDEDVQIERIKRRDNCTKEQALSRIKSQMSQGQKVKYADYIIDNSGTLEELKEKAYKFISDIKENWSE